MDDIFIYVVKEAIPFVFGGGIGGLLMFKWNRRSVKAKSIIEDLSAHKEIINDLEARIDNLINKVRLLEDNCKKCEFRKSDSLPIHNKTNA